MIHAANPVLNQTPKTLYGISVNVAFDVHAARMLDSAVPILKRDSIFGSQVAHFVVQRRFIGVHGTAFSDVFLNESCQMPVIYFGNRLCNYLTSALNNGDNRSFLAVESWRSASGILPHAAHVGFVYLDRWPLQFQIIAFGEHRANLLEHTPCGFVSDTAFSLNLLCRNPAASRTHQVHGIEPCLERSSGLFHDGSSERINLSPAVIAAICGAILDAIVFAFLLALLAVSDAARPSLIHQVSKANVIIRKLFVEVSNGISQVFGDVLFDWHRDSSDLTVKGYQNALRVVKGYLP